MINEEGNINLLTQSNCGKLTSFCAQMMSPLTVNISFYSHGLNSVLGPSRLLMVLVWCHLSHHDAHK